VGPAVLHQADGRRRGVSDADDVVSVRRDRGIDHGAQHLVVVADDEPHTVHLRTGEASTAVHSTDEARRVAAVDATGNGRRPVAGELLVGGACTTAAAVFALRGLAHRSLWGDEGVSALQVIGSNERLVEGLRAEPQFGLYHVLLRGWTVFGTSDFTLRLMSVVFAVLTVPALYAVARRLYDERIAGIAAAVLALNGLLLGYAHELRPYALAAFTATLATLFLLRALDEPDRPGRWTAWVVAATFAALSHPFGGMIVVAHGIVLLVRREVVPVRAVALRMAVPALLVGAVALEMLRLGPSRLGWIPPAGPYHIAQVGYELAGSHPTAFIAYALAIAGLMAAVVRADRAARRRIAFGAGVAVCLLVVPFVLTLGVSMVQSLFVSRYFIVCVPALVLLVAAGLGQLRGRVAVVATIGVLALSLPAAISPVRSTNQDWRHAAALVHSVGAHDLVVVVPTGLTTLRYYLEENWRSDRLRSVTGSEFSSSTNEQLQPCHLQAVWLVVLDGHGAMNELRRLAGTHSPEESVSLDGLVVTRFERTPGAGAVRPPDEGCP
ncbi:MAG: mannosyltransferase, partial [Acidimicrobiaceae bacterium]